MHSQQGTDEYEQKVRLCADTIRGNLKRPLTPLTVALLRNLTTSEEELNILNDALKMVGWKN